MTCSNERVFHYVVKLNCMSQILDLCLTDSPEVKLIKHVLRNDKDVRSALDGVIKSKNQWPGRRIGVKIERRMTVGEGIGDGYVAVVGSAFY